MRPLLGVFLFFTLLAGHAFSQTKKTTVAVLEFKSTGDFEKNEMTILTNRFRNMLVQTNTFDVLEREKMNDILKTQDFNISDNCNTAECAVQVGQLLGVQSMIAGDIGLFGETFTIDLRIIDVTTGKIMQTQTQDYVGKRDGLLGVMQIMAGSLAGAVDKQTVTKKFNLTINASAPKTAKSVDILIDGQKIGEKSVKLSLSEGRHSISVTTNSPDFTNYTKDIDLNSDQKLDAKLDYSESYKKRMADEAVKAKAAKELAEKENNVSAGTKKPNKTLWYVIGGVAVLGGGAAVLLGGGGSKGGSVRIPDPDLPPGQ